MNTVGHDDEDAVFRALADATRRRLLDHLFAHDGATQRELEAITDLTRFGVAKHLAVLEAAGLVTVRRRGREKQHYLNPVPIRLAGSCTNGDRTTIPSSPPSPRAA